MIALHILFQFSSRMQVSTRYNYNVYVFKRHIRVSLRTPSLRRVIPTSWSCRYFPVISTVVTVCVTLCLATLYCMCPLLIGEIQYINSPDSLWSTLFRMRFAYLVSLRDVEIVSSSRAKSDATGSSLLRPNFHR
jgi:hypothetical protein